MAKSNRKNRRKQQSTAAVGPRGITGPEPAPQADELVSFKDAQFWSRYKIGLLLVLAAFLYAYWPTLVWIEDAWRNEPDYSHGYLVPILAGLLCWFRADSFPGVSVRVHWVGLALVALAIVMRLVGRLIYADFLDGWSMIPMLCGIVCIFLGTKATIWALPAICFIILMIPMPYQAESLLSWNLQGFATDLSTTFLRILGQPAVSEGHVIWLGDQKLQVEEACSGLRIFIGVAALAYFWAVLASRSWVDRIVLIALAVPLAVFVNALRITVVGLLYQRFDDAAQQNTIHDISGYLMIPLAFALLWGIKAYWEHLYRPVNQWTAKDFVRASS